jgi:hypothetical protein
MATVTPMATELQVSDHLANRLSNLQIKQLGYTRYMEKEIVGVGLIPRHPAQSKQL